MFLFNVTGHPCFNVIQYIYTVAHCIKSSHWSRRDSILTTDFDQWSVSLEWQIETCSVITVHRQAYSNAWLQSTATRHRVILSISCPLHRKILFRCSSLWKLQLGRRANLIMTCRFFYSPSDYCLKLVCLWRIKSILISRTSLRFQPHDNLVVDLHTVMPLFWLWHDSTDTCCT